jgi:tRNA dimethylallyltransferase
LYCAFVTQKVLIIVGPTASGKSALGVALARQFNGEVISADSRQVYKGLDIGTGKITTREMRGVPHHLLDVTSPQKTFSAGDYTKKSKAAIDDIAKRGKLPIVVGGTGFYIDALMGRITLPDVPPNPGLRAQLAKKTVVQLYALLKKKDPRRAKMLSTPSERNNKVRLIRALEIASSNPENGSLGFPENRSLYDYLWIGVARNDTDLKKNITVRLRERMKKGMVKEAQRLHAAGLSYRRMEELGLEYRSLARFLQGDITKNQMEKELQSDIWRYSRKQIGYWKRNKDVRWFDPKSPKILPAVRRWLPK